MPKQSRSASLAALAAPALILVAPLLNYLSFHEYGLTRPEAGILVASCLALGLALGAAASLGGVVVRWLVLGAAIAFSVDVQVGDMEESHVFWTALVASLGVGWFLGRHLALLAVTVFGVMALGNVALPVGRLPHGDVLTISDRAGNPDLPPVVHLILDGHIGIEGIPSDTEDGRRLQSELRDFYTLNGFRLYGKAYSRFENTYNSIANALNFEAQPLDRHQWERGSSKHVLKRNRYFRTMADRGYGIRVYQSDYRDFCRAEGAKITSCYTYGYPGIKGFERDELTAEQRAIAIAVGFSNRSAAYRGIRSLYVHALSPAARRLGWTPPVWDWDGGAGIGPLFAEDLFDRIRSDVLAAPSGYVFFGHLLFPHEPFIFDSDCRPYPSARDRLPAWSPLAASPAVNTPETRAAAYDRYRRQLRCTTKQLKGLFDSMRAAGIYDRATIILHGDHGSRISLHRPKARNEAFLTHADYVDSFSTLFAVRRPFEEPRYDLRFLSIEILLERAIGEGRAQGRSDPIGEPYVLLFTGTRDPMIRRPMVDFGEATSPGDHVPADSDVAAPSNWLPH